MKNIIVKTVTVSDDILNIAKIIAVNLLDCPCPLDTLLYLSNRLSTQSTVEILPVTGKEYSSEDLLLDKTYLYVPCIPMKEVMNISDDIWRNIRSGMMCQLDNYKDLEKIYALTVDIFNSTDPFTLLTNLVYQYPDTWYNVLISCIKNNDNYGGYIIERALAGGVILSKVSPQRSYICKDKSNKLKMYFCTGRTIIHTKYSTLHVISKTGTFNSPEECIHFKILK